MSYHLLSVVEPVGEFALKASVGRTSICTHKEQTFHHAAALTKINQQGQSEWTARVRRGRIQYGNVARRFSSPVPGQIHDG